MKNPLSVIYWILAFTTLCDFTVQAQNRLIFDRTLHQFGSIKEIDTLIATQFTYTNNWNDTIYIDQTFVECGCTQPKLSSQIIAPGDSGTLQVSFNPNGRPGEFLKKVSLYGKGLDTAYHVEIMGFVEPHPLPIYMPSLQLSDLEFKMKTQSHLAIATNHVDIINVDTVDLYFELDKITLPEGLYLSGPLHISPGEQFKITLTWDVAASGWWDYHYEIIDIPVRRDTSLLPLRLVMSGTVVETFSQNEKNAPSIHLASQEIALGIVETETLVYDSLLISNKGKGDLIFRQIKSSCSCLKVIEAPTQLTAGESAYLKIRYISLPGQSGEQEALIAIKANDPIQPDLRLKVRAQVAKPAKNQP